MAFNIASPYKNPLREMFEDNHTDFDIYKEAAKRNLDPQLISDLLEKRRLSDAFAIQQKAEAAAAHEALYGKNAPGMAPAIDVAADMWLAKFGDVWVNEKELDNDYKVLLQRLCRFGAFEIMGNFDHYPAVYRLLPRELWGAQCK